MFPRTPPKGLPTVRSALLAIPTADASKADLYPFPHRSQKNSN